MSDGGGILKTTAIEIRAKEGVSLDSLARSSVLPREWGYMLLTNGEKESSQLFSTVVEQDDWRRLNGVWIERGNVCVL